MYITKSNEINSLALHTNYASNNFKLTTLEQDVLIAPHPTVGAIARKWLRFVAATIQLGDAPSALTFKPGSPN